MDSFPLVNPNPSPASCLGTPFQNLSLASRLSSHATLLQFRSVLWLPQTGTLSAVRSSVLSRCTPFQNLLCSPLPYGHRSVILFSTSQEDSKHSPSELDDKNDFESKDNEFDEAWNQMLVSFNEQALKLQSVSQEAYESYSKKAMITLKETAVQLKIQADKVGQDLSVIAKDITDDGKEYLNAATANSPEPVKDVVSTFTSFSGDLSEISRVYDFYLGIPYGLLLFLGGFLSFMLTGSISAIRFGVILGGVLLTLSILSLRSWKRGKPLSLALNGQTVVAGILFVREARLLMQRSSFCSYFTTLVSGVMFAFYLYRIAVSWSASNFNGGME